jgi:integrase
MSRWTCFSSSSTFVFLAEHGGFSLPGTARIELGVDPETATLLRRHRRAQLEEHLMVGDGYRDGDLLFAKPDGVHYHPEAVSKVFDRRVARWGLTRITFHDTHHTWATPALQAGVHPRSCRNGWATLPSPSPSTYTATPHRA